MLISQLKASNALEEQSLNFDRFILYERALAATGCGVAIADFRAPDAPIIYCNPAFERITGYSREEVLGRNCRFLQGTDTDGAAVEQIRAALRSRQECHVTLINYRKDGTPFWNELVLSPVCDEWGELAYYIGIQNDVSDRKQAEELQHLMQFSIERAVDAAFYFNRAGEILYVNEAACRLVECDRAKLLDLSVGEIIPKYVNSWSEHWQNLNYRGDLTSEAELRTQKGQSIFVEITENLFNFNGKDYNCAFVRDISDRKRAEDNLRSHIKREKLVTTIANRIRHSVDPDSVLNTAARQVRKVLAADRVVLYRFYPSETENWTGKAIVESVSNGYPSILENGPQENYFQSAYIPHYQKGGTRAIEDIDRADITPTHLARLKKFQVRATLTVPIFQNQRLWGLFIAHNCCQVRRWEKTEIELLQRLSVQLSIAMHQAFLFEQREQELRERSRAEAALRQSEKQLKTALHEVQRTQAQLIQHEKMSSLGQLVAGVAHEINNPISFISGNLTFVSEYALDILELLQLYRENHSHPSAEIQARVEEIDLDFLIEDFPKLLESMKMGSDRIEKIVRSLRNFSRLDEAGAKPVNLHEGLDNTLLVLQERLKQTQRPIEIIQTYDPLPAVEAYAGLLNQAFMNILANAIDALEESFNKNCAQPTDNEQINPPQIRIATQRLDEKWVVVRIADNGVGISEENRDRIFDPFFTTKAIGKGTGLGLCISYQIIVEKHQGQIECHSIPGEGTEFIIKLPT
ncbi:MAG: PAS domain S-box protein [Cyanobacteriota bacterium]|nr:PAS domain S-box protein [Cyanobacteriota bacterium]